MDTIAQDLRHALRSLLRSPSFTIVAALTLALGIGSATAGFSLLNWLLLRPVPGIRDGGRLAEVWFGTESERGGIAVSMVSYEERDALLAASPALSGLSGRARFTVSLGVGDAIPRQVRAELVMASYFDVLGVQPQRGRLLTAEDDAWPDGTRVAVISDRVWREWFGGGEIAGASLRLNGLAFTVIGVAPPSFHGTERLGEADLWLPGRTYLDVGRYPPDAKARHGGSGSPGYYEFVARLQLGAEFGQAQPQLVAAMRQAAKLNPKWTEHLARIDAKVFPGIGLFALGRESVVRPLRLVMGIVGLVLLIACANVANLLLLRAAARRGQTAVRIALGAGPGRLMQQHAAEALVLAGFGSGAGVLLAVWLTGLFRGTQLARLEVHDVGLDWRVAAFTVLVALISALVVAIAPGLAARRTDVAATLKASGRQMTRAPLRGSLVVLQVGASLTLVAGALLLARTFANLARVPLGLDPAGVFAFSVQPRALGYDKARTRAYYRQLLARSAALPGVARTSIAENVPFVCCSHHDPIGLPGAEAQTRIDVHWNNVGSGYFETLGLPIVLGRGFTDAETLTDTAVASAPVVLSLGLSQRLFASGNPVGQLLETQSYRGLQRLQVVGVVADSRWNDLEGDVPLFAYLPLGYDGDVVQAQLLVRSARPRTDLSAAIAQAARTLDADLPLSEPRSIVAGISGQLSPRRLLLLLLGVLSVLTVTLAGIGLYGLVSYGVELRTREFGIRIALGAAERRILKTAMRGGLRLAVAGIILGALGAVALTRLLRAYLFGVTPLDPMSLIVAAAVLALAALLASWIPARRAARVDPMVALRSE